MTLLFLGNLFIKCLKPWSFHLHWSSPRTRDTRSVFGSGAVITCFYDLGLSRLGFTQPPACLLNSETDWFNTCFIFVVFIFKLLMKNTVKAGLGICALSFTMYCSVSLSKRRSSGGSFEYQLLSNGEVWKAPRHSQMHWWCFASSAFK